MKNRRAIGEIMAALFLILIASISGVLLFTTSVRTSSVQGTILRSQVISESQSIQEKFEVLNAVPDSNEIKIWIYNYGKIEVNIADIYINGIRCDSDLFTGNLRLTQNELPEMIRITKPQGTSGPSFKITIVSTRGVKNVSEWIE